MQKYTRDGGNGGGEGGLARYDSNSPATSARPFFVHLPECDYSSRSLSARSANPQVSP